MRLQSRPERMRLLQLCTHFEGGGISRHAIDLSHSLRAKGHYVAIAGTRGKWMTEEIDRDFFYVDLHHVGEGGGPLPRRLLAAVRGGMALRRVLKSQRIDMVHAHESAPALVARIATFGTGIPVYVTFPRRRARADRPVREDRALFGRSGSHPQSQQRARLARDRRGSGGPVAGDGPRHPAKARPRPRACRGDALKAAWRRRPGADRHRRPVGASEGNRRAGRGGATSIERDPSLRFVVVGDGPQRDEAQGWAAEAGIADKLTFVGHSDEVQTYLAASDIFFLPSRWESCRSRSSRRFSAACPWSQPIRRASRSWWTRVSAGWSRSGTSMRWWRR